MDIKLLDFSKYMFLTFGIYKMKSFSCLGDSKFVLAKEYCQKSHILGDHPETTKNDWGEWKPITPCLTTPCLIPSRGVRILGRSCDLAKSKTLFSLYNKTGLVRPYNKCDDKQRSIQVCDAKSNIEQECMKLVTPSQFASQKCSQFQVRFPNCTS